MPTREILLVSLAIAAGVRIAPAHGQPDLPKYDSRFYVIYTDMNPDIERDIELRINFMAETYHQRTRAFSGQINKRLPFYIFRKLEDYQDAGGMPGSAGVFNGHQLMAVGGEKITPFTWHVIQHEGFHQFAHSVIRGEMPPWLNEGLAEYFGEALFTGDGYVTGVIPPDRLKSIKRQIEKREFLPLEALMKLTHQEWNARLTGANYDQAWAIVHFLAHADNNKYQRLIEAMMAEVGRGMNWETAWTRQFGRDFRAFEKRWHNYWLTLSDNPTADLYAEATTRTLTHFLARAVSEKQAFADVDEFFQAAKDDKLRVPAASWLPLTVLHEALARTPKLGRWTLDRPRGGPQRLICECDDGVKVIGTYVLGRGGKITKVDVRRIGSPTARKRR